MNGLRRLTGIWLLLALAAFCQPVAAGDRPASRRALAFLELGAGPRAYALGEAFSGLADDINSLSWNPAGLGQMAEPQILFMHNQWIANLRQEYLAAAHPFDWGTLAVQGTYLNSDVQLRRDDDGLLTGDGFNPYSLMLGASYGRNLGPGFFAGANLKYAREQLDDVTYGTVCLDAGGLYRPDGAWWSVGAAVQNLGLAVAGYPLPLTLRCGAAGRFLQDSLQVSLEASRTLPGWFCYGLGAEFWYQNIFAVRAGYLFRPEREGLDSLSGLRAGLGFNIQGYQVDYALAPQGDLGYGHRASFTYFFGGGRALASEKQALLADARLRGRQALSSQDYALAVDSFQKVLTFMPDDADAKAGLAQAQTGLRRQELAREISRRTAAAEAFRQAGQWTDAIEEYQRILLLDEANARAAQALAETRQEYQKQDIARFLEAGKQAYQRMDWADALLAWQAVLSLNPDHAEAKKMLQKTRAEMAKGGRELDPRAKEMFLEGLKRFEQQDYPAAIKLWTQVLVLSSTFKEAKAYLTLAQRKLAEQIAGLLANGNKYLPAGDLVRAAGSWYRILKLDPGRDDVRQLLADHEADFKQRAKELYFKGVSEYAEGFFKQAIAEWKDVLTLVPNYPGVNENIEKARQKISATQ